MSALLSQINNAAHQGAFGHNPRSEPTLAQLAAGNYKKGVVMVKGLSIAIENPAYTYRKGMDKSGKEWMCLMQAHYGYIQGHKGNDGDEMDVFIGNVPENDTVYIVNQKTADGYFDEHKIMLGFLSQQQAVDTYQHCFERGWTGLMSVVPCTMTQFKWWLANGDKSRPVTLDRLPYAGLERLDSVIWGGNDGSDLASHSGQVHKLLYQIRQCDDTHQALEPLSYNDLVQELCNQGFMYENYDALVVEYNKLEKKAKQLLMVMQGAASSVKPIGVTVGKPLTKGGVANVVAWFEMDDGQAVGVFFHNPDKTPKKIDPTDEMISYKWVLNKKDITIAVAPEQGKDLVIRTVAKRIMLLVEQNHDRFVKANGDKAALNQAEQDLSAQVAEKQGILKGLQDEVAALQVRKVEKEAEAARLAQEKAGVEQEVMTDKTGRAVYAVLTESYPQVWVLKSSRTRNNEGVYVRFGVTRITGAELVKRFETKEEAEKWAVENGYKVAGKETPDHLKDIVFSWDGNAEQQKLKSILANNPNLIQAYNQYFKENLQGKSVMTSIGKVWITGETRTEMRNRLTKFKAMIIPYVPEILINGKVGTEKANEDATESKKAKYESFIPFQHSVTIDGLEVLAMVQVGKMKSDGKLAYSLNVNQNQEVFDSMSEKAIFSPSQVVQEDQQGYRAVKNSLDSITAQDDGEINIEILSVYDKRTGKTLTEDDAEKLLFGEQATVVEPTEGNPEPPQERPLNWRTNLADARAVAKSLGIETKGKKLSFLVSDIAKAQAKIKHEQQKQSMIDAVPVAQEPEKHYSEQIIASLVANHGWTASTNSSATKEFTGMAAGGELSDGTRMLTARFDDKGRYIGIDKDGFDSTPIPETDMDMRDYMTDAQGGAKAFNDMVEAYVVKQREAVKPVLPAPVTQPVINRAFVKRFTELAKAAGAENVFSDEAQGNATAHFSNEATKKVSVVEIDISADILPPAGDVWAFERNSKIEVSDSEGNILATFNPTEVNLLKALDVANKYISDVAQPASEPPVTNPDRDYLQSIIEGRDTGLAPKEITAKMRTIITAAREAKDTEMMALGDLAAKAYAAQTKAKAAAKLAEVQ